MKYRKKPLEIEAILFTGENRHEVDEFVGEVDVPGGDDFRRVQFIGENKAIIPWIEGPLVASAGDFIIRGIKGEVYPCKPDIFHETYEAVRG